MNQLEGELPTNLGAMSSLVRILLQDNEFAGQLPSELGRLSMTLEELHAGTNRLEGTIPTELGQLTKLRLLDLGRNLTQQRTTAGWACGRVTAPSLGSVRSLLEQVCLKTKLWTDARCALACACV